ncbi:MAG: hypothetical protein H6706_25005 [Myxococcales bacterium]|nr:hypothetical protein [Myxococcales bacterium]
MVRSLALLLCLAAPAAAAPAKAGRAEALIFTTAFGFYEGIALSWLLDEHDLLPSGDAGVAAGAGLTLLTTGLTLGAGWWVTEEYGVNEAQARIVNSSLIWALLNGTMLTSGYGGDGEDALWASLVSGWSGQALGILLAANVDRTPGQVGLMNTVATWSGAETAVVLGAFHADQSGPYLTWPALVADAGLLAGSWIASRVIISDSRARMLDLGALAGGLAGPAALFMLWGPEEHLQSWYLGAVAVGIPAGIATAWYLTRDWDDGEAPEVSSRALMVPLAGGLF